MLSGDGGGVAPGGNEAGADPPAIAECCKKKWPGKWGRRAEVIPTVSVAPSPGADVEMDAALWGELHRHIGLERVAAQLPLHAFYRARSVCKKWSALPWNRAFLEQHSTTSLPEPYFVIHGKLGCHQAMLVKDVMLETWILKPLPAFAFQHTHTSVAHGVAYTCTHDTGSHSGCVVRGTLFNIHTKVFRRLPPLPIGSGGLECSKIAVDKQSGSYKVLVAGSKGGEVWVYESSTEVWARKAASPATFSCVDDSTHCEGVMYIKWRGYLERHEMADYMPLRPPQQAGGQMLGPRPPHVRSETKMFAYNFRENLWTVLPMAPPALRRVKEQGWQNLFVRGFGEWRGALRDVTFYAAGNVLYVWEFQHSSQEWLEVDRMPANVLEWFLDPKASSCENECRKIIKTSYWEHYILMWNHGFPQTPNVARLVLYDMALKSWETLNVGKDWICSQCPFDY